MAAWSKAVRQNQQTIALVPTMGFLHEGHLALMRSARKLADFVVASIFVNPMQFGPAEDFSRYPRELDRDQALLQKEKVDILFFPEAGTMYPPGFQTRVNVESLSQGLCGKSRPGHFEGVATVVAKLFHIVLPHWAVFGEKDLQQLTIIKRMVKDLDWDVQIFSHPTVREPDGLAMSSRNIYLSETDRKTSALCLWQSIELAREEVAYGHLDGLALKRKIESFIHKFPNTLIDYVEIIDADSLEPKGVIDQNTLLAMAVKVGRTRLIDNARLFVT